MIGRRPLGYVSLDDFQAHLDVLGKMDDADKALARMYLRSAEDIINQNTGGRFFLPIQPTLLEAVTGTSTGTWRFSVADSDSAQPGGEVLPEGGRLLVDSEVVDIGAVVARDDRVDVTVLARGTGTTTPATHAAGATCYVVKGFSASGRKLFPGDFLQLHNLWFGIDYWSAADIDTNIILGPETTRPYQWIQYGDGFREGQYLWMAATWGYSWSCPAAIQRATLLLAGDMMIRRGRDTTIAREVLEGRDVTFRAATAVPPEVDELLRPFQRVGIGPP